MYPSCFHCYLWFVVVVCFVLVNGYISHGMYLYMVCGVNA
ncbi:hypothetical protein SLPHG_CDS0051 [Salmonella phage Sephi301i]